ncbi:MAG: aldehyde ferredoxin oxidoreductase C-terminal domain-containing protein, partial [Candidatus Brocadiia bacterium]
CGIDDLDAVAKLTWLCNDLGLDTIEAGDTIAVAMDSGLAEFGDSEAAIKWLDEDIRTGTHLGHILGQGTEFTANAFGNPRSPTVKGQAMPAYEPRAIKGIGMTYAISTMGAVRVHNGTPRPTQQVRRVVLGRLVHCVDGAQPLPVAEPPREPVRLVVDY